MSRKSIVFFVVLVVVSFMLMTYQSRTGDVSTGTFISTIVNQAHSWASSLTDSITSPFHQMALRDEDNRLLKKQVDDLLLERQRFQEAMLENRRLHELLRLRESLPNYVATARVIGRGIDQWSKTIVLDRGSADGVVKNMSAITPKGLAGKIVSVSGSFSNLLLLTDIHFSASVRLQDSRREGVVSGTGTRACLLKYIPYEEEVKTGDIVVTSGLDELFPQGIPVGYVSKIDPAQGGGHFQYIEIIPFQDDAVMENVLVVK